MQFHHFFQSILYPKNFQSSGKLLKLFKNPPGGHLFDTTSSGETSIFIHKALSLLTLNMYENFNIDYI